MTFKTSLLVPVKMFNFRLHLFRFRAITSSLFHGVSGVIVVYDVASKDSFKKLPRNHSDDVT